MDTITKKTDSTDSNEVGGEIVSLCTKCKLALDHTIAAMVGEKVAKVRCKTCGSAHRYINPAAPTKSPTHRIKKLTPEETWDKLIHLSSSKRKIPYTLSGSFKQNDLIDHNRFGLGVVVQLLLGDKIQVAFKEGEKTLISRMTSPAQI